MLSNFQIPFHVRLLTRRFCVCPSEQTDLVPFKTEKFYFYGFLREDDGQVYQAALLFWLMEGEGISCFPPGTVSLDEACETQGV